MKKSTLIFLSNCHGNGQTIRKWTAASSVFQLRSYSRHYISLHCDVTLSTSIKLLDKLTLQICSLLCVSLAEVQGNCPIFMEIRDNIHQLSFTSFIFISFLILTLSARRPLSARFGGVFWTAETGASLRSLLWELYQTHTLWTWGASKLYLTLSILLRISTGILTFSWRRKVSFLPFALPAAHTQPLQYTFPRQNAKTTSSIWARACTVVHKLRTWYIPGRR